MEVVKALETLASICTTFPSLMGASKEILSTEAVTTGEPQCFMAASAAAISIQYINRPPIRLPKVLVSFGNTSSVMITSDSAGILILISIQKVWTKICGGYCSLRTEQIAQPNYNLSGNLSLTTGRVTFSIWAKGETTAGFNVQ